jgi:hypothetical protein
MGHRGAHEVHHAAPRFVPVRNRRHRSRLLNRSPDELRQRPVQRGPTPLVHDADGSDGPFPERALRLLTLSFYNITD